jgi:hypothetical protein
LVEMISDFHIYLLNYELSINISLNQKFS